ncbi:MAG: hypothetical protein H6728_17700 [Myxococcales bacterium]|nr:hypothetical protein [Myxococcales bacterium]MCB9644910.1 hypothetical protein [Myxococcales bacterium]
MSDGLYSLLITTVTVDPTKPSRIYAAADGLLYRSEDHGVRWRPLVRFQGTNRTASAQQVNRTQRLRELKEQILEEKIEDLSSQYGETYARERESELEREAEEEAEDQIAQRQRSRRNQTRGRLRRFVYRIVVAPSRPQRILVVTDGGAFLSDNYGKSFTTSFRGRRPGEGNVYTGVFDPRDHNKIWLGTQSGLWYSTNGGKLWRLVYGKLRRMTIREIRIHPFNPDIIYVATNRALFVSRDGGKRFLEPLTLPAGPRRITSLAILPTRPVRVIVGTGGGLYTSVRKGQDIRFRPLEAEGIGDRQIRYITSSKAAPLSLYLINDRGVFLSRNGGKRFKQLRDGMLSNVIRFISVSPTDANDIWAASEYGVMRWSKAIMGKVTRAKLERFERQLKREPSIWTVVLSTLRFMKVRTPFSDLHGRFRARAAMPELRFRAQINLDYDQDLIPFRNPIPIQSLEGRSIYFEIMAQWNMGRWIHDPRETSLLSELRNLRRTRDRLMTRVIRLFYARRRLQYRLLRFREKKIVRYLRLRLKLQEITAHIDGLTGGMFERSVRRVRRTTR